MTYAFLALWLALFAFPPTVRGRYATHNAARIVRPAGPINPDGSATEYAHVQERGEYRLHKLFGLAAGVPFLFVAIDPPLLALILQPVAMVAADQASRAFEAIDFAGHNAEIAAAEDDGAIGYREAEIARLERDRDKRGQDIADELRRWAWLGRIVHLLGRWG